MKTIVQKFLELLVKIKMRRARPTIIGVTGSIGKTSTKEAIYHVLKTGWRVCRSQKSLNTEIGLLLAVLEQPSGFKSPIKWAKILAKAVKNAMNGKPYDFMVLEYGADKPGDIEHLVSVIKPDIAVLTNIARVHQADGQFKDEKSVFDEKKKLAECLGNDGIAILNGEDKFIKTLKGKLHAKAHWFNSSGGIWADEIKSEDTGITAKIHFNNVVEEAKFPVAGKYHINIFLPALLIGLLQGISLKEGIESLQGFKLPPGRMSIIPAINGATILDSTYNASPQATVEALGVLHEFNGTRKIAVLGNMNELGSYTAEGHEKVGNAVGNWLDLLVTVGESAHLIAQTALKKGFPKARISVLNDSTAAGDFLKKFGLKKGDVVLLKGSQNKVRLEKAVKMLMTRPEEAKNLLCRQEPEWDKIS